MNDVTAPTAGPEAGNPAPKPQSDAPPQHPSGPPASEPRPNLSALSRARLRRVITVGGTLLALFVLWEVTTYFVAYTDDAYVRSDLVAVAPEVTGPIIAVHIVDNQEIKKGDKLVSIDPVPFQLEVSKRQAQIDEATSQLKVAQEELAVSQAALAKSTSAHTYATQEQSRYSDLARGA
jgi:multidrug efflux system membrane fusion protein